MLSVHPKYFFYLKYSDSRKLYRNVLTRPFKLLLPNFQSCNIPSADTKAGSRDHSEVL